MLFEGFIDSVLRRYHIGQPRVEDEGRLILERLHELLDQTKQGNTPSSESSEHETFGGKSS